MADMPNFGPVFAVPKPPSIAPFLPKPDELGEAAAAAKKAALLATAVGAALYIGTRFPHTTGPVVHFLTGFEPVPGKGIKPTPALALWAMPQPIGVVPPRWYGLPEEMSSPMFYVRAAGFAGGRVVNRANILARLRGQAERDARLYEQNTRRFSDATIAQRIAEIQSLNLLAPSIEPNYPRFSEIDQLVLLVAERRRRAVIRGDEFGDFVPSTQPRGLLSPVVDAAEPVAGTPDVVADIEALQRFFAANAADP